MLHVRNVLFAVKRDRHTALTACSASPADPMHICGTGGRNVVVYDTVDTTEVDAT